MKYIIIALCLFSFGLQAQLSDEQYLEKYQQAVQTYAGHNFNDAIIQLAPLTKAEYSNAVVPYAMYYYALSAYEAEKYFQCREMLRKLFTRFPEWDSMEEAYYLYADANLVENYYEEGLDYVERIRNETIANSSIALLQNYIPNIQNVNLLKTLSEKFPNQKIVAKTLVKRIQDRPYNSREDLELSDLLTNRFKLKDEYNKQNHGKTAVDYTRAFDDNTMDFGVLLPFDLGDVKNLKNQYVYDIFAGMQIAEKELQSDGIPIRLFGIDIGSDAIEAKEHLEDPKFKKMDLIFGPLYPRPNVVTTRYAEKNKIIQVHPLSNNLSLINNKSGIFLLQPSYSTQSEKAIEFVNSKKWGKTCAIYFGDGMKDSLFAYTYKKLAQEDGFTVLDIRKISESINPKNGINPGHVFFCGDDEFGSLAIRKMGMSKINCPMISTGSSFNFQKISRSLLARELYLLYPEFIDYNKNEVINFKKQYINTMNTIPSYFSYLGYDMVKFYGLMLKDGKEIYRLNLDESPNLDIFTLSGFDYSKGQNENKKVPIVKWEYGNFNIVN